MVKKQTKINFEGFMEVPEHIKKEYLNHKGYRNAIKNNLAGIRPRMEANQKAMLQYARELGQI